VVAAWPRLPDAVRAGLAGWDRLPDAIQAAIEAMFRAAARK
jgi:hypothetical protein